MFKPLTDSVSVAPQITLEQVAAAKLEGITLIINNRPDGEDPDAPQSADIEAAADAAGIGYAAIPVGHSGFSMSQVDAMIAALDGAQGPRLPIVVRERDQHCYGHWRAQNRVSARRGSPPMRQGRAMISRPYGRCWTPCLPMRGSRWHCD